MGEGVHFEIPVARWSAWPATPDEASALPDVRFIDSSLRRRLGPLARTMLGVARDCAAEATGLRLVFGSRHGELGYTVSMLQALAAGEPLSPTQFSLSVHNAPAGLLSTFRGDRAESTALAAGAQTLGQALLEGYCQLDEDPRTPVLVVYGDQPLPEAYHEFAEAREERAQVRALALLLSPEAGQRTSVRCAPAGDAPASDHGQAESFLRHLRRGGAGRWVGDGTLWSWH